VKIVSILPQRPGRLPESSSGRWSLRLARLFGCSEVVDLVTRTAGA
jgi:hypothetical protein